MSSSALRFQIRVAQKAEDVAGHADKPEAGGYEPESARAGLAREITEGVVAGCCDGGREDVEVD
jgi:hypothetical protein